MGGLWSQAHLHWHMKGEVTEKLDVKDGQSFIMSSVKKKNLQRILPGKLNENLQRKFPAALADLLEIPNPVDLQGITHRLHT